MSWNGLMIGALSRASRAFSVSEWREIAERTALFIRKNFPDKSGNWRRCWIDGHAGIDALAEDYAYFLWGIMELYKAAKHFNAGEKQLDDWLGFAGGLADIMLDRLWDGKNGGLFLSLPDSMNILPRMKSADDANSLPSANALAAIALSELGIISEEKKYSDYARKIIECFSRNAADEPVSYVSLIEAALMWKPVKKKPAPPAAPVPTDEELNREEPVPGSEPESPPQQTEDRRASRTARRTRAGAGTAGAERRRETRRRPARER